MDSTNKIFEVLQALEISDEEISSLGQAEDISANSISRFLDDSSFISRMNSSIGEIHIEGSGVKESSAPMVNVGNALSSIQTSIDAIGASIKGVKNLRGKISTSITSLTSLNVVASPLSGSLRILVSPEQQGFDEVFPDHGDNLFGLDEDFGARPLADLALEAMIDLIDDINPGSPNTGAFEERLYDLGPRVASSMKTMLEVFSDSDFDIEVTWKEPDKQERRAKINKEVSHYAVGVIERPKADIEIEEITGKLLTVTATIKDKIRIIDHANKDFVIEIGEISEQDLSQFHTGDAATVTAEKIATYYPGGRSTVKYKGLSITKPLSLESYMG